VQTGVAAGGSVLYFASLLDLVEASPTAVVVGVDVHLSEEARGILHPRLRLIRGDSVDPRVVAEVRDALSGCGDSNGVGLVVLDSDHRKEHVLAELEAYKELATVDSYVVVEDTNINGHPVSPFYGPGPHEAVEAFLKAHPEFDRDDVWKRNEFSFHQGGWPRRVR
jgi:cephalosporin hydroxylase